MEVADGGVSLEKLNMTQGERWLVQCKTVMDFMTANHRNPSRYDDNERGLYCNWIKHNKKLMKAGELKPNRVEKFKELLEMEEKYKRVNQWG